MLPPPAAQVAWLSAAVMPAVVLPSAPPPAACPPTAEEELSILESRRLNTSGPHPFGRGLSHNPSGTTRRRDAGPRLAGPGHKRLGLDPALGAGSSQRPAPAYPSSTSSYAATRGLPPRHGLPHSGDTALICARPASPPYSARGLPPRHCLPHCPTLLRAVRMSVSAGFAQWGDRQPSLASAPASPGIPTGIWRDRSYPRNCDHIILYSFKHYKNKTIYYYIMFI
jgi:hypothetical protein